MIGWKLKTNKHGREKAPLLNACLSVRECGTTMRPGVRSKVKSALAVLVIPAWGLVLHAPLVLNTDIESISQRIKIACLVPGVGLLVLSLIATLGTIIDSACLLRLATICGCIYWPVGVAPFAFYSVSGLWTLACRFPESLPARGLVLRNKLALPEKHPSVSIYS